VKHLLAATMSRNIPPLLRLYDGPERRNGGLGLVALCFELLLNLLCNLSWILPFVLETEYLF